MKNTFTRFLSAGKSTLLVYLRTGKRGLNVAASLKNPGTKATTGARQVFAFTEDEPLVNTEDKARTAYSVLLTDATDKGWIAVVKAAKKVRVAKRIGFESIPDATMLTEKLAADEAEKPENQDTAGLTGDGPDYDTRGYEGYDTVINKFGDLLEDKLASDAAQAASKKSKKGKK
jgi:hypothetical protein